MQSKIAKFHVERLEQRFEMGWLRDKVNEIIHDNQPNNKDLETPVYYWDE